ncbi:cation:proton antiporter [Nevskia soli]|uniref:cation:proton antiporter n=1 Tax=Nevskia soli TaxID=418856 RepID=UPI00068954E0|nr:cation:proton antiporter [Nevskia soli]
MHYDPFMLKIVAAILGILGVAFISRALRQPHVVGYLAAGILLGPHGLALLTERATLSRIGEFGVLLLLFFIGMENNPRDLLTRWRITFIGTAVQIGASVGAIWLLGWWLGWDHSRIILLGFVVSLSSTALVLNYLRETGQTEAKIGKDALGVLLAQDLAVIPMLIVIDFFGNDGISGKTIALQLVGGTLALALLSWIVWGKNLRLPFSEKLRGDRELQIFVAFALCLGFALLAEGFELSASLGAFLAGMLVGAARETEWVADRMEPFRVVFVAVFFVSVGLLVSLDFVVEHAMLVGFIAVAVLLGNTVINALIFHALGDPWRYSIYAGAHLAQIGEFSFVLAAVGVQSGLITNFEYQLVIAVISATLLLSPAWIGLIGRTQRRMLHTRKTRLDGSIAGG